MVKNVNVVIYEVTVDAVTYAFDRKRDALSLFEAVERSLGKVGYKNEGFSNLKTPDIRMERKLYETEAEVALAMEKQAAIEEDEIVKNAGAY
jgi:hypothetical protein